MAKRRDIGGIRIFRTWPGEAHNLGESEPRVAYASNKCQYVVRPVITFQQYMNIQSRYCIERRHTAIGSIRGSLPEMDHPDTSYVLVPIEC